MKEESARKRGRDVTPLNFVTKVSGGLWYTEARVEMFWSITFSR